MALLLALCGIALAKGVEVVWMKQTDIINISNECQWMTSNIASMNDKYFLISYENATGTVENMIDSSMVAQIYDTSGNKINTETIILADAPPSTTAVFRQQPSQCQCNYNSDKAIQNNLMYGWIHEADGYKKANASYKIIYPSNYDATVNPNKLNTSEWIVADDTNINSLYSAESGVCACLEDGTFAYFWINAYIQNNSVIDEYMIFLNQNGDNINGKGVYFIKAMPELQSITYLLPCITPPNAESNCDTFLGICSDGNGWLYSVSEKGIVLRNEFKINQHAQKVEKDGILDGISLSNGLYGILYVDDAKDVRLLFLSGNSTQLNVNGKGNWNEKVNYDQEEIVWIKMKEIQDESMNNMAIVYLCIIYSDAETSIYGSLYTVIVNNDMVNTEIVGEPFEIYAKPSSNYPIQSINLEAIGKTMMVGWSEDNYKFSATIVTLNITT